MAPPTALVPQLKWAQRPDTVFLTVDCQDCENVKNTITNDKMSCEFTSNGKNFAFEFDFHAPIKSDDVLFNNKRCLEFLFKKEKDDEDSWPRINAGNKMKNLNADWNKWVDSDDEGEEFDASGMQGMPGGAGGMGGMPGMEGMGGMGGMPGMEGMGGRGGMPGMGGEGGGMDMAALQQMMAGMKGGGKGGDGPGGMDFSGMDFSKMGMGGEGGADEADSDDEDLPDLEDDEDAKVD